MNQTIVSYLESLLKLEFSPLMVALVFLVAIAIVIGALATIGGLGTYAERKISADLQARQGPNRVGPYGILQFLADGVKMIMKEDIVPREADKMIFAIAPALCLMGVLASLAVVPFSSGFILTDLNIGILYLLGVSSLVGVGIFLGGYASNSKWSLLGGMRGASQIISYEIPVTITIIGIVIIAGGLSFKTFIQGQTGLPHGWYIFHNPFTFIAFFVYFIGALAETNRAPFDLPEAESELVSGYHTEYSGMRFAFFALAEYIEVFVVCGVAVAIFLGGYLVPFGLGGETLLGQILQLGSFFTKTFLLYYVVIWVRWTLPRLRVDQVMTLCWKYLTPIAIFNLLGIAIWIWAFDGSSIFDLLTASNGSSGH
jgi:NADH-quinone oxidoreductase subunit H